VKALNVQKVRLGLSRLARLAYEAFYEPAGCVSSLAEACLSPVIPAKGGIQKKYHNMWGAQFF